MSVIEAKIQQLTKTGAALCDGDWYGDAGLATVMLDLLR